LQVQETISAAERLAHSLHPWRTSFAVVPLFALANTGVPLSRRRRRPSATATGGCWAASPHSERYGIDWDVIFLLLGMMVIVGVVKQTGLFDYLGIWSANRAGGRPFRILVT
jgi:di/tricarboxylate transporter